MLSAASGAGGGAVNPNAWDISKASYSNDSFSVNAQVGNPGSLFFSSDGTKMFQLSIGQSVYEYSLSTAWDVTSASYSQSFSVAAAGGNTRGLFFRADGTKMYVIGSTDNDINEYNLSVAWDVSTASLVQEFDGSSNISNASGLHFSSDGTWWYAVDYTNQSIRQFALSSAWDVSTSSYVQAFSVSTQEGTPRDVFFKQDGTKMYVMGTAGDDINEYTLGNAWDVSTASYVQNFSVSAQETDPRGLFWKDDGTQFFVVGAIQDTVFSYLISPT
jgi:hypothetical protein